MKMELVYDETTGTWGEAPEVYRTIECATKEDYEYAKKAIKCYKELEAKHWDECRQIAHYDDELKEAKQLLKAAVEDFQFLESHSEDEEGNCLINYQGCKVDCKICPLNNNGKCEPNGGCKWNYEAEALKLIKEDETDEHS